MIKHKKIFLSKIKNKFSWNIIWNTIPNHAEISLLSKSDLRELFEDMVTVDFQNDFCSEMHQDFVFFIILKLFLISAHQNDQKI
jgi:hypothetical protein